MAFETPISYFPFPISYFLFPISYFLFPISCHPSSLLERETILHTTTSDSSYTALTLTQGLGETLRAE